MKKFLLTFIFLIGFLIVPVSVIFAASVVGEEVLGIDNIEAYFASLAALSAIVLPVTQFFKNIFKSSGNWTKYLSWVVSIGLAFVGWWLNLGMFEGIKIVWVVVYGIAAGLVSNSVFDIGILQAILSLFKSKTDS